VDCHETGRYRFDIIAKMIYSGCQQGVMSMAWTVVSVNAQVDAEIEAQPDDIKARLLRLRMAISDGGPTCVPPQYIKHIVGKLWELRLKGKDGIARALYVTMSERRLVIVRVFTKKTEKTPPQEIRLALQRAKAIR
jgi:phage-related protein